jgi:hypothetical protein
LIKVRLKADTALAYVYSAPRCEVRHRDRNAAFSGMTAALPVPLDITGGSGEPQQIVGELGSPAPHLRYE